MSSLKSLYLSASVIILLSFGLFSCKAIKKTLNKATSTMSNVDSTFQSVAGNIDALQKALVPVDTLVYRAVSGALEGVTSDDSKQNLDTLSAMLSRNIVKYVNAALDSLDTATPAAKLITGIKDSLFAQSTTDEITKLLDVVFDKAGNELTGIINQVINSITSKANEKKLRSLGNALVSGITDSLGLKINESLKDLDFNSLRDSILTNLINEQFRDTLALVVKASTKGAAEEAEGVIKFLKDNIMKVLGGLALLAGGIIWAIFHFRRKDVNETSDLVMDEISNANENITVKDLKRSIQNKASKHKNEKKINKLLKDKDLM